MEQATAVAPVKKREIFGWAMYDFANSSYTTVVVTFVYSAFFVAHIVPPELAHMKNSYWSLAVALSTALAIVLGPLIGVLCDYSGQKKRYLAVCTLLSVFGTGGLFFVNPGDIALGIAFLVISNTAWMLSESFVASFLPELSTKANIGRISGIGWGIGYIGGLLSLLLVFALITTNFQANPNGFIHQNQLAMVAIACFYALGAMPTFWLVKERATAKPGFEKTDWRALSKAAATRLIAMRAIIADYPLLFQFFLAFTVFSAGIAVVVKFFGIYAQEEIGISGSTLLIIGAVLNISSMIGALCFGLLEDMIGAKRTILLSLLWWAIGIVGIYLLTPLAALSGITEANLFVLIAFIAGSALGATQSASRSMVGQLSRPADCALLFGLWGTFGRFAIILGMTFGPISDLLGRHSALLFILLYFAIGAAMLAPIPLQRALARD